MLRAEPVCKWKRRPAKTLVLTSCSILAIVMFILYVLLNIKNRRAATRPTSIPHHGTYAVPGAAPMQQPQQNYSSAYKPAFASAASPAPVGGVYGTPSPAPMYNAHASSARFSVHDGASSTVVSPIAPSPGPVEYGNMYRQYQTPQQQQPEYMYNRIAAAWRMAELQQPDGHWEWSGELATIVQQWGLQTLTADPEQVTSVTNACLTNMCQFIWTARREGRDSAVLSPAELARLASYNGDMSWAKAAMDRATSWLASQHP